MTRAYTYTVPLPSEHCFLGCLFRISPARLGFRLNCMRHEHFAYGSVCRVPSSSASTWSHRFNFWNTYVCTYVRTLQDDAFHDPTLFMNRIASKSFIALDLSRFFFSGTHHHGGFTVRSVALCQPCCACLFLKVLQ